MKLICTLLMLSIFVGPLNTTLIAGPKGFGGGPKPTAAPRPAPRPSAPAVSGHMPIARPAAPMARPSVPVARPQPMQRPTPPAVARPQPVTRPSVPVARPQPITRPQPPVRPAPLPAKPVVTTPPKTKPSLVPKPTPLPGVITPKPTPMPTPITPKVNPVLPKVNPIQPKVVVPERPKPMPIPPTTRPKVDLPNPKGNPLIPKGNPVTPKVNPNPPKKDLPERPRPKIDLPERPRPMPQPITPTRPVRPGIGNGVGNGNNNGSNNSTWINNRPIINNNINNNYNINHNQWNSYRPPLPSYNHPWGGWSNGYWNGYYGGWHTNWHSGYSTFWNNAAWFTAGVTTGWLFAPRVASYTYVNPFYVAPATPTTIIYDYSQPIVTTPVAPAPATSSTDVPVNLNVTINPTTTINEKPSAQEKVAPDVSKLTEESANKLKEENGAVIDKAREEFKKKNFAQALIEIDAAIKKVPNDPALHELRALILFAQKNYKEASAAIYSVLASGPGMNWETMSGQYKDPADYSAQLRALEEHYKANPKASEDAFLLAYHYMVLEEKEAAIDRLEDVQALVPGDELSKRILEFLKNPPKEPVPTAEKPKPGS